jgi:hypothetical protein
MHCVAQRRRALCPLPTHRRGYAEVAMMAAEVSRFDPFRRLHSMPDRKLHPAWGFSVPTSNAQQTLRAVSILAIRTRSRQVDGHSARRPELEEIERQVVCAGSWSTQTALRRSASRYLRLHGTAAPSRIFTRASPDSSGSISAT